MILATREKTGKFDWVLIALYLMLVVFGWVNIYSAVYTDEHSFILDFSQKYGMQFIWMLSAFVIAFLILFVLPQELYSTLSPILYAGILLLLTAVIFLGKEINGSRSWFVLGPVSFQPAEVSKITTSLLLSYVMSKYGFRISKARDMFTVALIILIPILLIVMEKETGSARVYLGFIFMLYREGLSGWLLVFGFISIFLFVITLKFSPIIAIDILFFLTSTATCLVTRKLIRWIIPTICTSLFIAFIPYFQSLDGMQWCNIMKPEYWALVIILPISVIKVIGNLRKRIPYFKVISSIFTVSLMLIFSVNFIFNNVLQPHQRARIENLLGIQEDLKGAGYNVHQSQIAIGSGGFWGKGYLEGTQTKFNFVPEQSTDFIFCTVGEEWGFFGCAVIISLYTALICRIINDSEKQKDSFTRIYGYCIASCLFMHVFINIGMTIGIVPVIGIPLPFLSYGGSSLWTFTIMLFIFVKLEQQRGN